MTSTPDDPPHAEPAPPGAPKAAQSEPAAGAGAGSASDTADLEQVDLAQALRELRQGELPRELADARDVALVFIDRHQEVHHYTTGGTALPGDRPAAPPPQTLAGLTVNPLPAREIDRIRAVYVRPTAYVAAERILRQEGLVILHGKSGTGKRAAAIQLLAQLGFQAAAQPAVYELDPNQALADVRLDELPRYTALLLETTNPAAFQGMDRFRLDALSKILADRARNNGLVIVVGELPTAFPRAKLDVTCPWTLSWTEDLRTVQRTILARHLRYHLARVGDESGIAETLPDRLQEFAELEVVLGEPLEMDALAELALLFEPVLRGTVSPQEALARLDTRAAQDVRAWFESPTHSLEHKTLLVAAAAFNGALVQEVEQAALRLQALLGAAQRNEETRPAATPPADPFAAGNSRSRRLQEINAELVEVTVDGGHYGPTGGQALQLRNPAWQKAVLYYVWDELPGLQQPLIDWLRQYGAGGNMRMGRRAAAALGALGRRNFPVIESEVLRSWAKSYQRQERENAGQVLAITMWDEKQSGASARLLANWAGQRTNPRLQWTAAAACGGLAGLRYPQQTLAALYVVAENTLRQPALLEPLVQALRTAYLAGQAAPDRRQAVLQTLVQWSDPAGAGDPAQRKAVARAALAAFWMLLWPAPGDPGWRQALADARTPGAPQELTVTLLRRSLNFRLPKDLLRPGDELHPRNIAREGLATLIVEVRRAEDEQLAGDLEELIHALTASCRAHGAATGSEEMERLRYFAQNATDWNEARKVAPELVAQFL